MRSEIEIPKVNIDSNISHVFSIQNICRIEKKCFCFKNRENFFKKYKFYHFIVNICQCSGINDAVAYEYNLQCVKWLLNLQRFRIIFDFIVFLMH